HREAPGLRTALNRDRLPVPTAHRQPRRRPEHVPRPRAARPLPAAQRARDGAAHGIDTEGARGDDDPLDPPAGGDAVRRAAAVGRGCARRDVELEARHPRRAHGRARRRPDGAGALAREAARRARPRRHPHLAQPARRLRGGEPDHRAPARPQRRRLQACGDDAAGGRARDHCGHADEGGGHPGDRSRMTTTTEAPAFVTTEPVESPTTRLWENIKGGNLGSAPVALGLSIIVVVFAFWAPNFFTAVNFNNIIVQMSGTTMLAYGVVFVLLLGEIDLSIAYLSGLTGVMAAELQKPGSGHMLPGIWPIVVALLIAVAI